MRDLFLPIRQAYYSVLEGNVTLSGQVIHFYDVVPQEIVNPDTNELIPTPYPYIVVASQQAQAITVTRGCESYECTIQLDIVTRYAAGDGGRKDADTIADQIYAILNNPLPKKDGLQMGRTTIDSDFDQGREMNETYTWNRRFIRVKNTVTLK